MIMIRLLLIAEVLLAIFVWPARAAVVPVATGAFAAAFAAAACGDTLQLAPGTHPRLSVNTKICPATNMIRVTGPASAVIDTWRFTNVRGLEVSGVTLKSSLNGVALQFDVSNAMAGGQPNFRCGDIRVRNVAGIGAYSAAVGQPFVLGGGKGVSFMFCEDVGVYDSAFRGHANAVLFGQSRRVEMIGNQCEFGSSDCADFGLVWGALIERNTVRSTIVFDGAHPDGFQFFSRAFYPNTLIPAPPTSDIVVRDNFVVADAQGVFFGNHRRVYPDGLEHDDGGFDRVVIEGNVVAMGGGNAILAGDARGVTVRRNWVRTTPGAPFVATIKLLRSTVVLRCGNRVEGYGRRPAEIDPRCAD